MNAAKRPAVARLGDRPEGYSEWLIDVKARVHAARQRAAFAVNRELLQLYWQIGDELREHQANASWGSGVIAQVSADLRAAFPDMKGFSATNLKYMRAFAEAWPDFPIRQQPVGELPWGHNIVLLTKLESETSRLAHAQQALTHGWSRNALVLHIENRTLERQGRALTNFAARMPEPQSDLARETLKDPYRFDFLSLGSEASERELENALTNHMTQFLLELGPASRSSGASSTSRWAKRTSTSTCSFTTCGSARTSWSSSRLATSSPNTRVS